MTIPDLEPAALEAARSAIRYMSHPETPWTDEQVGAVIHAYLSAARSTAPEAGKAAEEISKRLKWISEARWNEDADLDSVCTYADQALLYVGALASVAPSGAEPLAWRRERDGHLIDQPRPGYAPLYASPQAVPVEDVAGPIEQMAEAMWRAEVKDFPAAAKVRAIAPWSEESPNVQAKWRALATVAAGTVAAALTSLSAERDEARASWKQAIEMYEMEAARVDPALKELADLRRKLEEARSLAEQAEHCIVGYAAKANIEAAMHRLAERASSVLAALSGASE